MSGFSPDESAACRRLTDLAIAEDLGTGGDRTSLATIAAGGRATAAFVARTGWRPRRSASRRNGVPRGRTRALLHGQN